MKNVYLRKNHLPLLLIAFMNFSIAKSNFQNSGAGTVVVTSNSKFVIENMHYGEGGWVGIMTLGATLSEQQCIVSKSYPHAEIQSAWDSGLRIANICYGNNLWVISMSKGSKFSRQKLYRRDAFPSDDIKADWDEDLYISDLLYGEGKWTLIMSVAQGYTNQRWRKLAEFPADEIKEAWDLDYYITNLSYTNGEWVLVMTLNVGYTNQKWQKSAVFPMEWIQTNWNEKYDLTHLSYGDGLWVAVMSMNGDNTQRLHKPGDLHIEWIKKVWGEEGTVSQSGSLTETSTPISNNINSVKEVRIGSLTWMTSNLDVDRFRNGDAIFHAKTTAQWEQAGREKKPAWCYYGNIDANRVTFGKLYNWYAIIDSRGLAPSGWRIPTQNDWKSLISSVGGESVGGNNIKSSMGWESGGDGNDKFGFAAMPGGRREANGNFSLLGRGAMFWSSTAEGTEYAYFVGLFNSDQEISIQTSRRQNGFAVRCVK